MSTRSVKRKERENNAATVPDSTSETLETQEEATTTATKLGADDADPSTDVVAEESLQVAIETTPPEGIADGDPTPKRLKTNGDTADVGEEDGAVLVPPPDPVQEALTNAAIAVATAVEAMPATPETTTEITGTAIEASKQPPTTSKASSSRSSKKKSLMTVPEHLDPTNWNHFDNFLFLLLNVKAEKNNYHVNKAEYPTLHAWMVLLKKEYKIHTNALHHAAHHASSPSTANSNTTTVPTSRLTTSQIRVLESLHIPLTSRGDDHWNRFHDLLVQYGQSHGHVLVPRLCEVPGLGDWVTDQRRQYKAKMQGQPSQLTTLRLEKLEALNFAWQVRNRPEWDSRFQELLDYKAVAGDCKVPQHYKPNRALGKWVAKQREQYKLKQRGLHSFLTPYRIEKLESCGFVWQVRTALDHDAEDTQATAATTAAANANVAAITAPQQPVGASVGGAELVGSPVTNLDATVLVPMGDDVPILPQEDEGLAHGAAVDV